MGDVFYANAESCSEVPKRNRISRDAIGKAGEKILLGILLLNFMNFIENTLCYV